MPDTPAQAKWATDDEKTKFIERVRINNQGIKQKKWKNDQAKEALIDPLTYLLFFMMFAQALVVGGLNTFNSILINSAFGFDVSATCDIIRAGLTSGLDLAAGLDPAFGLPNRSLLPHRLAGYQVQADRALYGRFHLCEHHWHLRVAFRRSVHHHTGRTFDRLLLHAELPSDQSVNVRHDVAQRRRTNEEVDRLHALL